MLTIWPLGKKTSIFSPSLHHFFGFCSFYSFIFLTHDLFSRVQVTVLQAARLWQGLVGTRGAAQAPAPPGLALPCARACLCPGLVCEVGVKIVATFQPTSQGCCGDTMISGLFMLLCCAGSRRPPETGQLPSDPSASTLRGPRSSLPALSLLLHQGAA